MYLQFTNNSYFFKAIIANDKIEIKPNTRWHNIEPFETLWHLALRSTKLLYHYFQTSSNLFKIWCNNAKAWGQRNPKTQSKFSKTERLQSKIVFLMKITVLLAFYNIFWFFNENPFRTDQRKRQFSWNFFQFS